MMKTTSRRVSVLGLGLMGSALAEAMLNAGHHVTVWNRTSAKAEPLLAKGAHVAHSVSEAILASEVTLICVTSHQATMELLEAVTCPVSGKTLVQLTTTTPEESTDLAEWADYHEMCYLGGSILGFPSTVLSGLAMLIFSGPRDPFDANEALFRALGTARHLSSEPGDCAVFGHVWYSYSFCVGMAFMQGAAMTRAMGFSLDAYLDAVKVRSPEIVEQCLIRGEMISNRSYETSDAQIKVFIEACEGTVSLCRANGIDDSLPSAMLNNFKRASAAGYDDSDLAAIVEVLAPSA
jgi:3-hydroxyisobutyrate dehydrogenase-like beta-hydroxyacid dehydrogenase